MFIELNMMITFIFIFRRPIIISWGRDTGTILWPIWNSIRIYGLEVGSSRGLNKNQVYGLSNTTADNLRSARSASTVGSSQSKEFVALQQHTAQLTKKYNHLSSEYIQLKEQHRAESEQQRAYEQLREIVMNMAQGGTCAPNPFLLYDSSSSSTFILICNKHYLPLKFHLIFFWNTFIL